MARFTYLCNLAPDWRDPEVNNALRQLWRDPFFYVLAGAALAWAGLGGFGWVAALFTVGCAALALVDLRTMLLPDIFTYGLALLALIAGPQSWALALGGAAIGGGLFWFIRWFYVWRTGQPGMGLGDVKLMAMLGLWVGPGGLLLILLASSLLAIPVMLARHLIQPEHTGEPMPYGPFLLASGWLAFAYGSSLFAGLLCAREVLLRVLQLH